MHFVSLGVKQIGKFFYQVPDVDAGELQNYTLANIFSQLSSTSFGYETPYDTQVEAAMSLFTFGAPLAGYTSSADDVDDQNNEIGEWCYNELHDLFTEFQEENVDKFDFYWDCATMGDWYAQEVLMKDALLMGATFTSVYVLMIINTGSVWLASYVLLSPFLK